VSRRHWHHEDKRWALWRERWAAGLGWLGVKSVEVNFLFFYQAQALATALIFSAPLHLVCVVSPATDANTQPALHALEIAACALWAVAFALENVADHQLSVFHAEQTVSGPLNGGVLRTGLWRFSCVRCVFLRDWNCILVLISNRLYFYIIFRCHHVCVQPAPKLLFRVSDLGRVRLVCAAIGARRVRHCTARLGARSRLLFSGPLYWCDCFA
jgi:hypothetical protein